MTRLIELTATSTASAEAALDHATRLAEEIFHQPCWVEVVAARQSLDAENSPRWQVTVKVGVAGEAGPRS